MGIGASIFLIAVGAVLAFAVDGPVAGVDLSTIGWILMAVGGLGLLAVLVIMMPRSSHSFLSALADRRRVERAERAEYEARSAQAYDAGNGARPAYAAPPPSYSYASGGDMVEYYAGVDAYDREIWVRGRVEHRERRGDGEWLYMRPTHPDSGGQPAQAAWVAADQTRVIPRYGQQP
ncbi:MAG TPA: DUF6458 family protein [Actinopolymorphaceae bacterium]|nr:DUF6458 family protein [Actinopolymorphaceae bacterium]